MLRCVFVAVAMLCVAAAGHVRAAEAVPALDDLAGDWMETASLGNLPALNNFHGGLKIGGDLASVEFLTFPPFSQGGGSGVLSIGGRVPKAACCRWYPYQVLRRAMLDGVQIESATRMVFEAEGVLFRLQLTNTTGQPKTLDLKLDLEGRIRRFDVTWPCPYPRPDDHAFAAATAQGGRVLLVRDAKSPARTAYAFARPPDRLQAVGEKGVAGWTVTLPPHASRTLDYVLAVAGDDRRAVASAAGWAAAFDATFQEAKDRWEGRWRDAFTPGNRHFSGHLPTLVTADRKLSRVYYLSLLSPLMLERTNFPVSNRVFATGGPEWAVTLMYFWDTGLQPHVWALLEPASMREHLKGWLAMDIYSCYARDCLSGHAVGPWYGANDLMVFRCLDAYLNVTGDRAFLGERVAGKTVLQHMEAIALHGKQLARPGSPLGDYGGADNLLECVPTYIHRVPSLNAANVWMLRRAARLLEAAGQKARAGELRSEAARAASGGVGSVHAGRGDLVQPASRREQGPVAARLRLRHHRPFDSRRPDAVDEERDGGVRRAGVAHEELVAGAVAVRHRRRQIRQARPRPHGLLRCLGGGDDRRDVGLWVRGQGAGLPAPYRGADP